MVARKQFVQISPETCTLTAIDKRPIERQTSAWFRVSFSAPLLGGYEEPETLSYQFDLNCPIGGDVRHIELNRAFNGKNNNPSKSIC